MYKPRQRGEPTDKVVTYRPIDSKPLENQEPNEQEPLPGTGQAGFDRLPANMKEAAIQQGQKEYYGPEVGTRLMAHHTDLNHGIDHSGQAGLHTSEINSDSQKTLFNRQPQYPVEQEHMDSSKQCNNDNYNAVICNAQRPKASELNPKVADDYAKSQQYLNKKRPVSEAS